MILNLALVTNQSQSLCLCPITNHLYWSCNLKSVLKLAVSKFSGNVGKKKNQYHEAIDSNTSEKQLVYAQCISQLSALYSLNYLTDLLISSCFDCTTVPGPARGVAALFQFSYLFFESWITKTNVAK